MLREPERATCLKLDPSFPAAELTRYRSIIDLSSSVSNRHLRTLNLIFGLITKFAMAIVQEDRK